MKKISWPKSDWYRLVARQDDDPVTIDRVSHENHDFTLGAKFRSRFVEPVVFEVDGEVGGPRLPTLFLPEPVFSVRFLSMLRQAGGVRLDDYAARIVDSDGKTCKFSTKYRAVNILELVDCVDMKRSEYEMTEGMRLFDRVVINPKRVGNSDLFRLKHAEEYIVVSKAFAAQLNLSPYRDVSLVPIAT